MSDSSTRPNCCEKQAPKKYPKGGPLQDASGTVIATSFYLVLISNDRHHRGYRLVYTVFVGCVGKPDAPLRSFITGKRGKQRVSPPDMPGTETFEIEGKNIGAFEEMRAELEHIIRTNGFLCDSYRNEVTASRQYDDQG